MKITAVIMAGGKGERFWPKSRLNLPKQFLSLTKDKKTMIEHTVDRLKSMIQLDDIFVVTNKNYVNLVAEKLPDLPKENILIEPVGKNTAPCIGFAASVINKKYDDAMMVILPSDHLIKDNSAYINTLKIAIDIANKDNNLVTIGITPNYPETGYGYINFDKISFTDGGYRVKKFVEKPDKVKATEYLSSGEYLWNSGMFVWKVSSIMKNFEKYMPELYDGLVKIKSRVGESDFDHVLLECFNKFDSESIDYGVMEKADNIFTVPGNFGWDDVGSWLALERINNQDENGNVIVGDSLDNVISIDTHGSIISSNKKLIALSGLDDVIVIDTDDALLICKKDSAQKVKDIIKKLKEKEKYELL